MGRSKKIDSGASWEAVFGEMVSLRLLIRKSGLEEGGRIPTEKGDIFAGHLRGQFAWA
jgi:hypothetical protein